MKLREIISEPIRYSVARLLFGRSETLELAAALSTQSGFEILPSFPPL
jgi:hypothetical protein